MFFEECVFVEETRTFLGTINFEKPDRNGDEAITYEMIFNENFTQNE